MESRLLGFPCFPYSVISMACFGTRFTKSLFIAKARCGNRDDLSEMPTSGHVNRISLSVSELATSRFSKAREEITQSRTT